MRTALVASLVGVAAILVVMVHWGTGDGQMNMRTGALRYRLMGIPIHYDGLRRYQAQWQDLQMPDTWETVVTYPLTSSNNTDLMIRNFVYGIAIWGTYDKAIARFLASDLYTYIKRSHGQCGLPDYSEYYSQSFVDVRTGTLRMIDDRDLVEYYDRLDDPMVQKIMLVLRSLPSQKD